MPDAEDDGEQRSSVVPYGFGTSKAYTVDAIVAVGFFETTAETFSWTPVQHYSIFFWLVDQNLIHTCLQLYTIIHVHTVHESDWYLRHSEQIYR